MANEKILVVDDDKNICELLRLYLVKEGYNVTMVHDGGAALAEFDKLHPDLVLLDVMMPVMDGWEVCRKIRAKDNTVVLGPYEELFRKEIRVGEFHWISGEIPAEPVPCKVKIRYRQPEQPAYVYPEADGGARIVFSEPQRAATPGQAAVAYDGDTVLGGGVITELMQ